MFLPSPVPALLELVSRRVGYDSIALFEPRDGRSNFFHGACHAIAQDEGVRHVNVGKAANLGIERLDGEGFILSGDRLARI